MSLELNFAERRVLGVLMEKGFTTPEQYPLTLNALINGSNQKSCRDPMSYLQEEEVLDTVDSLREKGLVSVVRSTGGRTDRYRHRCADTLELEGREAAVLAELLLRGPQTDGEIRQRANRMVPIPSLGELAVAMENLRTHDPCLIACVTPDGRKRGAKYAHTLYPADERPEGASAVGTPILASAQAPAPTPDYSTSTAKPSYSSSPSTATAAAPMAAASGEVAALRSELDAARERIEKLEGRVDELESTFMRFFQ